jgi:hypothetical protein
MCTKQRHKETLTQKLLRLQVDNRGPRPWKPYEAAPTENMALPWIPATFYELRWAVMRQNPLCWLVWKKRITLGELLVFMALAAEMIWATLAFVADSEFRVNVILTGAHAHPFLYICASFSVLVG